MNQVGGSKTQLVLCLDFPEKGGRCRCTFSPLQWLTKGPPAVGKGSSASEPKEVKVAKEKA